MPIPPVTTTSFGSTCVKCGIIKKSSKLSCCALGGSWFGKCGSAGNSGYDHTWQEGIRACQARQFQAEVPQRHQNLATHSVAFMLLPKTIIPVVNGTTTHKVNPAIVESVHNILDSASQRTPYHASASTSIISRKCGELMHVAIRVSITFIILLVLRS